MGSLQKNYTGLDFFVAKFEKFSINKGDGPQTGKNPVVLPIHEQLPAEEPAKNKKEGRT
jgi:hypothetical protein